MWLRAQGRHNDRRLYPDEVPGSTGEEEGEEEEEGDKEEDFLEVESARHLAVG